MRTLLTHPAVEPLVARALRARAVTPAARFFLRESGGRRSVATYGLRGSDLRIVLEHGTPDVLTLDEVFYQGIYDPPAEVAAALARVGRPLRVLDVGANVGMFGLDVLRRWPDALLVAYEPDPRNVALHRRNIAANPAARWELRAQAAGNADGEIRFATGNFTMSARADDDPHAAALPLRDVLPDVLSSDYLKIDAEGSEWEILADPRFAGTPAAAVALEYHPDRCPAPDARAEAERLLREAGFEVREIETQAPPGYGSLWAWRP